MAIEKKAMTMEAMDIELKMLELESKRAELAAKQLEIQERTANVQDLNERLAERQMKRTDKGQISKTNGVTLNKMIYERKMIQHGCNHRKGGNGLQGYVQGKGMSPEHAVILHQTNVGDVWGMCLRCKKTEKPPAKSSHTINGVLNTETYNAAWAAYKAFLDLYSGHTMSTSVHWKMTEEALEAHRTHMLGANLF